MRSFPKIKPIILICIFGLFIRILFLLYGAEIYYGKPDFQMFGDCTDYISHIVNLIDKGVYTVEMGHEFGYFYRMPFYPFFIGLFYILTSHNLSLTLDITIWAQVLLDTVSIYFFYRICYNIFKNKPLANLGGFLFAIYPFSIVWIAVIHSETLALFLLLGSLFFFTQDSSRIRYPLAGLFLSCAVLCRPQHAIFVPLLFLALIIKHLHERKLLYGFMVQFCVFFLVSFAPWVLRNYFLHDQLIFLVNISTLQRKDVTGFLTYSGILKAEYDPQFSDIIMMRPVRFPYPAYEKEGDSLKLAEIVELSRKCGSGFNSWNSKFLGKNNCDEEIYKGFLELSNQLKRDHFFHVFVKVPLLNFYKMVFKSNLYLKNSGKRGVFVSERSRLRPKNYVFGITGFLFLVRTCLILIGITGLVFVVKNKSIPGYVKFLLISYPVFWYFYMAEIHRNIEIRFLLYLDILLIIPASYVIQKVVRFISKVQGGVCFSPQLKQGG